MFWKDTSFRDVGCTVAFARDARMPHSGDLIGKDDFQMNWREQAELYRADDKPVIDSDTLKFGFEKPKRRAKRRG